MTCAHDGSVTFFAYDARGREVERATFPAGYHGATTRPPLSAATSVISTRWHATFNLPTQRAEPGRISAWSYSARGLPTGSSWTATTDGTGAAKFSAGKTGSTYATGYSYTAAGLVSTVVERETPVGGTALETQRWTMAYNAVGDLTRITDVTGGNLIGRASAYDAQGRLLTGTTSLGLPVTYGYSPRGFVTSRSVNGKTSTFTQNSVGLTTEVRLPDGQTVRFEYDPTHRLTNVRLNGVLVSTRTTRDGSPENTRWAILREQLQKAVDALVRPAQAQAFALPAGPGSVAPGMALPGQPSASPAGILMGDDRPSSGAGALPPFDARARALRSLIERVTRMCQCDPSGGYDRPTLRPMGYAHILNSGHMGPTWSSKSYFTEPVNQALVDEVVSKAAPRDNSSGIYYVADMGREVGLARKKIDGVRTFASTRSVTLVVEPEHCSSLFRSRNEVVTMYPEITR